MKKLRSTLDDSDRKKINSIQDVEKILNETKVEIESVRTQLSEKGYEVSRRDIRAEGRKMSGARLAEDMYATVEAMRRQYADDPEAMELVAEFEKELGPSILTAVQQAETTDPAPVTEERTLGREYQDTKKRLRRALKSPENASADNVVSGVSDIEKTLIDVANERLSAEDAVEAMEFITREKPKGMSEAEHDIKRLNEMVDFIDDRSKKGGKTDTTPMPDIRRAMNEKEFNEAMDRDTVKFEEGEKARISKYKAMKKMLKAEERGGRKGYAQAVTDNAKLEKALLSYARQYLGKEDFKQVATMIKDLKTSKGTKTWETAVKKFNKFTDKIDQMHYDARVKAATTAFKALHKRLKKMVFRPEYKAKIDKLLEDIDPKRMTDKKRYDLMGLVQAIENENVSDDGEVSITDKISDQTKEDLERLGKMNIYDMEPEDLEALTGSVKEIIHKNRMKNTLLGKQRSRNIRAVVQAVRNSMAEAWGYGEKGKRVLREGAEARNFISKGLSMLTRLRTKFMALDRGEGGANQNFADETLTAAENQKITNVTQVQEYINKKMAEMDLDPETLAGMSDALRGKTEPVEITLGGKKAKITRGQKVALALLAKQESSRKVILSSGMKIDLQSEGAIKRGIRKAKAISDEVLRGDRTRGELAYEEFNGITEEELNKIVSEVNSNKEEAAIMKLWRGLSDSVLLPMINESYLKINNRALEGLPEYFPQSRWSLEVKGGKDSTGAQLNTADYNGETLAAWSGLKERTGGSAKLQLQDVFDVIGEHVERAASYNAYAPALRDLNAIFGNSKVAKDMDRALGSGTNADIMKGINTIERKKTPSQLMKALSKAKNRASFAKLLHPTTSMMQAFSLHQALMDLGSKHLAIGIKNKNKSEVKDVLEQSPWLKARVEGGYSDADVSSYMNEDSTSMLFGIKGGKKDRLSDFAVKSWGMFDRGAIKSIIAGVYSEMKAKTPDATMEEIARRAEFVVRNSQPTFSKTDQAMYKADSEIAQLLFPFRSFLDKALDQMIRSSYRGKKDMAKNLALAGVVSPLLAASLKYMQKLALGDEEDKEQPEAFIQHLKRSMITGNAGYIPLIGNAVNAYIRITEYGREAESLLGAPVLDDALSLVNGMAYASESFGQFVSGERNRTNREYKYKKSLEKSLENFVRASGMLGVPDRLILDLKKFVKQQLLEEKPKSNGRKRRRRRSR
jgi:hypothetical protein